MMMMLFSIGVLGFTGYGPSKYDTSAGSTPIAEVTGFGPNHYKERAMKGFGDLSLVDYNLEVDNNFNRDILAEVVWQVLDSTHASVMSLQSIRRNEIAALKTRGLGHYEILNWDKGSVNVLGGPLSYLPILFDTISLDRKGNGYINEPGNEQVIYGSWASFEHKDTKRWFTVVNMDIYSPFSKKTDVEVANILRDLRKEHTVDNNPVIFMGDINSISNKLQKVIDDKYVNPLDVDLNAKESPRFTMKNPSDIFNNTERDFTLIRDTASHVVKVNYARILRGGISTFHYPIHVIVTFERDGDPSKVSNGATSSPTNK